MINEVPFITNPPQHPRHHSLWVDSSVADAPVLKQYDKSTDSWYIVGGGTGAGSATPYGARYFASMAPLTIAPGDSVDAGELLFEPPAADTTEGAVVFDDGWFVVGNGLWQVHFGIAWTFVSGAVGDVVLGMEPEGDHYVFLGGSIPNDVTTPHTARWSEILGQVSQVEQVAPKIENSSDKAVVLDTSASSVTIQRIA